MKLVCCPKCSDIFNLRVKVERACICGASGGMYVDDVNAEVWGQAIPLGFGNSTFIDALRARPLEGMGMRFTAFVIPIHCPSVTHKSGPE